MSTGDTDLEAPPLRLLHNGVQKSTPAHTELLASCARKLRIHGVSQATLQQQTISALCRYVQTIGRVGRVPSHQDVQGNAATVAATAMYANHLGRVSITAQLNMHQWKPIITISGSQLCIRREYSAKASSFKFQLAPRIISVETTRDASY